MPGSPLSAGDEFVLQVDGFEVVGKGGSGEVGHPIWCLQDKEVRAALQKVKDIEVDGRRALVTSHHTALFPHFNPSHTSAATSSSLLPPSLPQHSPPFLQSSLSISSLPPPPISSTTPFPLSHRPHWI